ncbi:hypothetical protein NHP20013_09860 [Helicobacter bizzozeronii]|nr:hypothetical protein NHP20013_09860 [Helicobacter bizzozeronii]
MKQDDCITIITYNHRRYSFDKIFNIVASNQLQQTPLKDVSFIQQKVVVDKNLVVTTC